MNISRRGFFLGLLCLIALMMAIKGEAPSNKTNKAVTEAVVNATKGSTSAEKLDEEKDDEDDEGYKELLEDRNDTEENKTESRFFACGMLYFLKLKQDSSIIGSITKAVPNLKSAREDKIKGMILKKCNDSITDEAVQEVIVGSKCLDNWV